MSRCPPWTLLLVLLPLACRPDAPLEPPAASPALPAEEHPGARALDEAPAEVPIPLTLLVPGDGTVIPFSFPSPQLRWEDNSQANLFRLRLRTGPDAPWLAEVLTEARVYRFSAEQWDRMRAQIGEGGAFEVELTAASALPDGTLLRGPTKVASRGRLSGPGEHPTGHILYSWLARPAGGPPGPTTRSYGLRLVPMRLAMDGSVERALPEFSAGETIHELEGSADDSGKRPVPAPPPGDREAALRWPGLDHPIEATTSFSADLSGIKREPGVATWSQVPEARPYHCSGCHTSSSNGRHLVLTGDDNFGVGDQIAGDTMLFVVDVAAGRFERVIDGAVSPRFHPTDPDRLAYAWTGTQMSRDFRNTVFGSDVHVLDLATGEDRALPGASDPTRCEASPEWSPDGEAVFFSRTAPGSPCEAHRGEFELMRVPWNGGAGGEVRPVPGVNEEGTSNFYARVSPDGRWIVFTRSRGGYYAVGSGDLWAVPTDGSAPARRLSVSSDVQETTHAFSPDGNWIVFASNRDRVDQIRTYVARFHPDGTTAPALPAPHAGDDGISAFNVDWVR